MDQQAINNAMMLQALAGSNGQGFGFYNPSILGPVGLAGQMGAHADWDKFAREGRPSQNIEDHRRGWSFPNPADWIGSKLEKAAYY